ncbi:hypothetical protein CL656_04165 [bacterium]|nr:hypothetical protein [bacterium]|tara:strand:- start:48 stop:437 length:390 start_codon:yes stop_codon:yes gene_type:complete
MRFLSEKNKYILLIQLGLAIYLLFTLLISEYKNYKVQRYIDDFDLRNQKIAAENVLLNNDLSYFNSPEYQEKIAKQNLGLINPGEKVLVIQVEDSLSESQRYEKSIQESEIKRINALPNHKKWWYYLFS